MRPGAMQQAHVEAISASLPVAQHAAAMKIVAFNGIWQTVSHVARPGLGRRDVVAHPRLCFRLRAILSRLRHAGACQELSKQARCLGQLEESLAGCGSSPRIPLFAADGAV